MKYVFVTKALGDDTKTISDFSLLQKNVENELYWFCENINAIFDDKDHWEMIEATCRLSCTCSVCYKEDQTGNKKPVELDCIDELRSHLHKRHRVYMCNLCLEQKKMFICEQYIVVYQITLESTCHLG